MLLRQVVYTVLFWLFTAYAVFAVIVATASFIDALIWMNPFGWQGIFR